MTAPSGRSPLRIGGILLLGVAVAAALIGLASLGAGSEDRGNTAAPVTSAPPSGDPGPDADPATPQPTFTPGDGLAAPPSAGPAPTSGAATPDTAPSPSAPAAQPPAPGTAASRVSVRVYNNSTIQGLAGRAAEDFRRRGWQVDEVGNYPQGIIPTSTVYHRPGSDEEAAARLLAQQFGLRVEPRFKGIQNSSSGLIVIVTRDYGG